MDRGRVVLPRPLLPAEQGRMKINGHNLAARSRNRVSRVYLGKGARKRLMADWKAFNKGWRRAGGRPAFAMRIVEVVYDNGDNGIAAIVRRLSK